MHAAVYVLAVAERNMYARHTRAAEEVMRDRMIKAKEMVQEERDKKTSIAGGKCAHSCVGIEPCRWSVHYQLAL